MSCQTCKGLLLFAAVLLGAAAGLFVGYFIAAAIATATGFAVAAIKAALAVIGGLIGLGMGLAAVPAHLCCELGVADCCEQGAAKFWRTLRRRLHEHGGELTAADCAELRAVIGTLLANRQIEQAEADHLTAIRARHCP